MLPPGSNLFYGIRQDQAARLSAAVQSIRDLYPTSTFATDNLITVAKTLGFLNDPRLTDAVSAVAESDQERSLVWRLHVLTWAASRALPVPGEFVECGVLRGFSSAVLCRYLDFANVPKRFYLYDTFSGPAESTSTPEERAAWSRFPALADPDRLEARVRQTFAPYPNVTIVRGPVPDTFAQAAPQAISFLHIDMNSTRAELLALEHLYDRVSPGGTILLDDYGWAFNRKQMLAELDFFRARNQPVLELPTGQGMVIKSP